MAKSIKLIKFNKPDQTVIGFVDSYKALGSDKVANDKAPGINHDLPRHADFQYAMDRLAPHLLIANGYREPKDCNGNYLSATHFNDMFFTQDEEHDNFGGIEVSGIVIKGKDFHDGVIITGYHFAPNGDKVPIRTPSISLLEDPQGYNYPLRSILLIQIDMLLSEAMEYHQRRKHGAGVQVQMELNGKAPEPSAESEEPGDKLDKVINERKAGKTSGVKKMTIKQAASNPLPEEKDLVA